MDIKLNIDKEVVQVKCGKCNTGAAVDIEHIMDKMDDVMDSVEKDGVDIDHADFKVDSSEFDVVATIDKCLDEDDDETERLKMRLTCKTCGDFVSFEAGPEVEIDKDLVEIDITTAKLQTEGGEKTD